jgi:hypothetical protein
LGAALNEIKASGRIKTYVVCKHNHVLGLAWFVADTCDIMLVN